jgi:hypothetical protein
VKAGKILLLLFISLQQEVTVVEDRFLTLFLRKYIEFSMHSSINKKELAVHMRHKNV